MKKIFVVIVNYNGKKDVLDCIDSLRMVILPPGVALTTLIVNNGCRDEETMQDPEVKIENSIILTNSQNLGFSGGSNTGIRYALSHDGAYVLLLNSDTIVDKNFLKELFQNAEKDAKIGVVVPKIYFAKGYEFHKERYTKNELGNVIWYAGGIMDWNNIIGFHRGVDEVDKEQFNKIEETEIATGCCKLIKKEVFEKIGLLNENYFLYYEDSDFSMRVKKTDYRIMYIPAAIIWHKNAGSAGGSGSQLQDYYIARNRMLFGMQYASLRTKLALIRESLGILVKGRPALKKGIIDFYLHRLSKGNR